MIAERCIRICAKMAHAKIKGNEHPEDVEAHLIRYLRAQGYTWQRDERDVVRAAADAVLLAMADRDGSAGSFD